MEKIKNWGFNPEKELEEQSEKDYILGSKRTPDIKGQADDVSSLVIAVFAWPKTVNGIYQRVEYTVNHAVDMIREAAIKYLPTGQVQKGSRDWMNCATNAPCNEIEKQMNYLIINELLSDDLISWLVGKSYYHSLNGFEISNAFNSILSETSKDGNSLKAPLESIRTDGIIPLSLLPDDKTMSWEQYHDPARITQEMRDLGKEYKTRVLMNYERVYDSNFKKFTDVFWKIFDSYVDSVDGDFIKHLAPNYKMMNYGYHITLNQLTQKKNMKTIPVKLIQKEGNRDVFMLTKDGLRSIYVGDNIKAKETFGNAYDEFLNYVDFIPPTAGFSIFNEGNFIKALLEVFKRFGKNNN